MWKARIFLALLASFCLLTSSCSNVDIGKALDLGIGYNKGYAPDQPIPFDHSFHAGELKMDCQYCHSQVSRAEHAGAPSLNVCMNCHTAIRQYKGKPSPHIERLVDAYQKGESVEWVRVHMLPDHARFNHGAHVKVGVACTTCHGKVEEMTKVYQHSTLSMGWCVTCHRENETGKQGPLNCSTCHY